MKTRYARAFAHALVMLGLTAYPTWAADLSTGATSGEVAHKQLLNRLFPQPSTNSQLKPPFIRQYQVDGDETGSIMTYQPNGATVTTANSFFLDMGTNGRTCLTCHQPQNGWALSAETRRA